VRGNYCWQLNIVLVSKKKDLFFFNWKDCPGWCRKSNLDSVLLEDNGDSECRWHFGEKEQWKKTYCS
jgi:hypothetical protein